MKFLNARHTALCALTAGSLFIVSGCVVRSYPLVKDRVDQELTGNRGYILGRSPQEAEGANKTTRMTRVVEIELHPVIRFEKKSKKEKAPVPLQEPPRDRPMWGKQGGAVEGSTQIIQEISEPPTGSLVQKTQPYKVEKGDTLQKISMKFYGTTRKWMKLFDVNKEVLKSPEKLYPGQMLQIPVEPMQEPRENLK